jgi:cyclic lactone autoinducer peptide
MKHFLAKYSGVLLTALATFIVASPNSWAYVHRPETPKELLK